MTTTVVPGDAVVSPKKSANVEVNRHDGLLEVDSYPEIISVHLNKGTELPMLVVTDVLVVTTRLVARLVVP